MRTKQKILQLSRQRLLTVSFAVIFNLLLAGSVCGTFAWYTYATRAGFEKAYHGVTVGDTGSLEAGLVSSIELPDYDEYDLVEDKVSLADEGKIIYWSKGGESGIEARTLRYVVGNNGFATNMVNPVTTGSDDKVSDDEFHLFKAPSALQDHQCQYLEYADDESYVHISFVFRYNDPELDFDYVPDKDIYFTSCEVQTSEDSPDKELYKAVRVFAEGLNSKYVINPTAESSGKNNVGGILDLNHDGFYDYDGSGYEYIYGESNTYHFNSEVTQEDGTLPEEERTTFIANHKKDKYALNEETYVPKTVSYKNMSDFVDKAIPVTSTSSNYHYLAPLEFYIYVEGWDSHVIDEENGSGFNMTINFEVNP